MPLVPAATSLSRSVASARPGRLRTRLRPYQIASATRTTPRYQSRSSAAVGDAEDHEVALAAEAEAEEAEGLDRDALVAARDRGGVLEDVLAEEDEAERREAEVDAAHAAGDRAEGRAREAGEADGGEQRQRRRDATLGQVRVAVGADGDEERVPERELAGDPDQQREPDRGDHRRHREQRGLQPEALEVERQRRQHDDDRGGDAARPKHGSPRASRRARTAAPAARAA